MHKAALVVAIALLTPARSTHAAEIWSGHDFAFSKADFADHTIEANQDRITDSVWLTRADSAGIFNIAQEATYVFSSPADTEWSFGTTADIDTLTFLPWRDAVAANPPAMVGQNMVVHLISDDIYIDIRFTSWTALAAGGGFSYVRALPPPPPCEADLDGDADTDVFDFSIFASNFGASVTPGTNGDFDADGVVTVFDFATFAADFGCTP